MTTPRFRSLLREPPVHFLLLGAAGCVVAAWTSALVFSPRISRTTTYHDTGKVEVRYPPANSEHGWPFHSLTSEVPMDDGYVVITAIEFGNEVLPMWPLWFGFLIDTLLYATVLWFLLV